MAYTPGPWRIEMTGNYMRLYMPGPLKGDVARGYVGEDNARLIAAAPELLEALEDTLSLAISAMVEANNCGGEFDIDGETEHVKHLIAKVKGKDG